MFAIERNLKGQSPSEERVRAPQMLMLPPNQHACTWQIYVFLETLSVLCRSFTSSSFCFPLFGHLGTLCLQVQSKETEMEAVKLTSEVAHLRAALKASENLVADRDNQITDLHHDLHSLDTRRGDLQVAVASTSSHAGRLKSRAQAADARLHAMHRQLQEADEGNEALRQQVSELRVRSFNVATQFDLILDCQLHSWPLARWLSTSTFHKVPPPPPRNTVPEIRYQYFGLVLWWLIQDPQVQQHPSWFPTVPN